MVFLSPTVVASVPPVVVEMVCVLDWYLFNCPYSLFACAQAQYAFLLLGC